MSGLWSKARAAADDARGLFQTGRLDGGCNRAYYAMFNAARALLLAKGFKAREAKKHATVLRLFSNEFVGKGIFDTDDGRALRLAGDARNVADYDDAGITPAKAQAVLQSMERFMEAAARAMPENRESGR